MVNCLDKLAQEKVWLGELTVQTKQYSRQGDTEIPPQFLTNLPFFFDERNIEEKKSK